jgi:serine/threonine protein kinase
MAEVYLACRKVAGVEKRLVIKRMRRQRVVDPSFFELFVREAQLSMSLVQQNIVPVFDFGRIGEDVFLAMEHVDGKDLGSTLGQQPGPVSPILAAFIIAECCAALDHAHRIVLPGAPGGIVHRDVTPRNILLSWAGEVKLADFGIAAAIGDGNRRIIGTPAYMAPEQARGEPVDGRADIYAAGLILWEMLRGQRVRGGDDIDDMMAMARTGDVPQNADSEAMPAELNAIVARATCSDRAQRFDSARDMLEALDHYLVNARSQAKLPAPRMMLATWIGAKWPQRADAGDAMAMQPVGMVTFLDDGIANVVGTGTQRSMAMTIDEPSPDDATAALQSDARADSNEVQEPALPDERNVSKTQRKGIDLPSAVRPGAKAIIGILAGAALVAAASVAITKQLSEKPQNNVANAAPTNSSIPPAMTTPTAAQAQVTKPPTPEMAVTAADQAVPTPLGLRPKPKATARFNDKSSGQTPSRDNPSAKAAAIILIPVTIGSRPWANVTVDGGAKTYETPATMQLTPGPHRFTFRNPQLSITKEVTLQVPALGVLRHVEQLP